MESDTILITCFVHSGLAIGSVFAGPISETVGRNPVYVISRCFHVIWLIGAALARNYTSQIVLRFLAGLSGSILLAIHAASTADLFGPVHRTVFWPVIALTSFWGTVLSPIVGAWISDLGVWWRWTEWIAVILSGSTLILTLLFLPETFAPVLLSWRAKHLRDITGCERFKSELDLQKTFAQRLKTALLRALHMITREPIVVLLGGWLVLEYIIVFSLLHGFSYMFEDTYDFSTGLTEMPFLSIGIGTLLFVGGLVPIYYHLYKKKARRLHEQLSDDSRADLITTANIPGTDLPAPEYRFWMALLAGPALPISLFWLGWTNYSFISPWSSMCALCLLGFSWAGIYVTVYQYILDTYGIYAGSALAIITCWRYLFSGASNLYSDPMYEGIGVQWSATWLGILAVLQAPLPLLFYRYGHWIRMKSSFAGRYARPDNPRERTGNALSWK